MFFLRVLHSLFDEVSPPVPLDLGWDLEGFSWPFALPPLHPLALLCLLGHLSRRLAEYGFEYVCCLVVEVASGVPMQRTW